MLKYRLRNFHKKYKLLLIITVVYVEDFHRAVCFGQNNEEKDRLHDTYNSRIRKPLRPKRKKDAPVDSVPLFAKVAHLSERL